MNIQISNSNELTPRQALVLELVRKRILETGIAPTVREIAKMLGTSSPNGALKHLLQLQRKGYIRREATTARGITLVDEPITLPLAGKISAGRPLLAVEQPERISFQPLLAEGRCCYIVDGPGLPTAQLGPGDVIIVDQKTAPRNGQPVLRVDGRLALQPRRGGRIAGAVVGVVRRWK